MARQPSKSDRLSALARELGATTTPYYLSAPRTRAEPAPGWYWVPDGLDYPDYLGANDRRAEWKLTSLLDHAHAS